MNKIFIGDAMTILKTLPDQSVHCCVTSPPYWGLRDYGVDGQIGLEATPDEYVVKMVAIFREVRRVLRDDGTLWLNLGDTYAAARSYQVVDNKHKDVGNKIGHSAPIGFKQKDLIGIPWRVAFALQADGWYLRSDIIWSKPNPMPESVTDRPTKAHEYIFLMSKSARYFYDSDAIKEDGTLSSVERLNQDIEQQKRSYRIPGKTNGPMKAVGKIDKQRGHSRRHAGFNERWDAMSREEQCSVKRNKRSVWTVATYPFKGAHFATFPRKLIEPCIMAGCPCGGTVFDPFAGSGTTGQVSRDLGRNFILIELNEKYIDMAIRRTVDLFTTPEVINA